MIKGFLNLPWFAWAGLALVLALIYSFMWIPKSAETAIGFRYFVLRWGHSLTWIFLALSFSLRGVGSELNGGSSFFAIAGGVMYLLFMMIAFVVK